MDSNLKNSKFVFFIGKQFPEQCAKILEFTVAWRVYKIETEKLNSAELSA